MKTKHSHNLLYVVTIFMALLLLIVVLPASADENMNLEVEVTFEYDLARAVFPMVNEFREGKADSGTWYWNEDNQTQTVLTNLQPLSYDYGLEKIAMQRAAECAIFYSHTRPNGSSCMTIYPTYGARGENIAAGQRSANEVYLDWREDNDKYAGQGHRRNMLDTSFASIGIGCVRANGRLYWCQAFYSGTTGQAETLSSPIVIEASPTTVKITAAEALAESISIQEGASDNLPKISAIFNNNYTFVGATILNPAWQSQGSQITVEGGKIKGAAGGKTSLLWQLGSCSVTLPATVICSAHTEKIIAAVEPTCTETGLTEGVECSVCGTVISEQIIVAANGHTPIIDPGKEPTCTETGLTDGEICSVCGTVTRKKTEIPKKEHASVMKPGKEPTCTEPGYTDSGICDICGTVTKEQEVLPAKGHTPVTIPGLEATTTHAGLTEGSYCDVCGVMLKAQETIPKLAEQELKISIHDLTLSAKKNSIKVEWEKLTNSDFKKVKKLKKKIKIEIQVSRDKNFKTDVITKVVKTSKSSVTIKGLKKGKKYYVRVRAFAEDGNNKYVSKWFKKNIKTKKK